MGSGPSRENAIQQMEPDKAAIIHEALAIFDKQGEKQDFIQEALKKVEKSDDVVKVVKEAIESQEALKFTDENKGKLLKLLEEKKDAFVAIAKRIKVGGAYLYEGKGMYEGAGDHDGKKMLSGKELIHGGNLETYETTLNSETKKKLFRDVMETLKGTLGYVPNSADSQEKQINDAIKKIPSAAKFDGKPEKHKEACLQIGKKINAAFGRDVVSLENDVCQQVGDMLASLNAGMHEEFVVVYNELQTVLENIDILLLAGKEMIASLQEKLKDTPAGQNVEIEERIEILKEVCKELDTQSLMMKNLLNVHMDKRKKDLSELFKSEDLASIERIASLPGKKGYGKVMNRILRKLALTGVVSAIIEKALRDIGVSLADYKSMGSTHQLNKKFKDVMITMPNDEELNKKFKALDTLSSFFDRKEQLEWAGRGEDDVDGAEEGDNVRQGGDSKWAPSALDSRVKNRRRLIQLILNTFNREFDEQLNKLGQSLGMLIMKIGTEIPVSDKLLAFKDALGRFSETTVRNKNAYFALIGYYNDAHSKNIKDNIMNELKMMDSHLAGLMESNESGDSRHFGDVRSHVKAIFNLIDKYTADVQTKFGGDEERAPSVEGGDDVEGGSALIEIEPIKFKTTDNFRTMEQKFSYQVGIAQIKRNLERSSKELKFYGEGYSDKISHGIFSYLEEQKTDVDNLKKLIKDHKINHADKDDIDENIKTDKQCEDEKSKGIKFLEDMWDAKKKFWRTIEAAESYMKYFTDGIVRNPGDIKDIRNMLDDIEVIEKWHTTKSGDHFANFFDVFPRVMDKAEKSQGYGGVGADQHYYELINSHDKAGRYENVAVPSIGVIAKDKVKEGLKNMVALKNLLSIFVNVGSKFGGEELRKKISMTPAEMYNNIACYLQYSAIRQGWSHDAGKPYTHSHNNVDNLGIYSANFPNANDADKAERVILKKLCGISGASIHDEKATKTYSRFNFKKENDFFVILLKALASKVLTVTGSYDLFDRPHEINTSFNHLRMIIGGSDDAPKISEKALPLYLRLPLLIQFYRQIFDYEGRKRPYDHKWKDVNNSAKITFVPEIEGVFSGLIQLLFKKINRVDPAAYSDEDVKEIIRQCNEIYTKMAAKHPQNTVTETINELIAEVNRRYGVVTKDDVKNYAEFDKERMDYSKYVDKYANPPDDDPRPDDIPILPGEEDERVQQLSGAERLLGDMSPLESDQVGYKKYEINIEHKKLIDRFRCAIDETLQSDGDKFNFHDAIKHVEAKLRAETDAEERFKLAASLIRGNDIQSKVNDMKIVIFHETVVAGLNALSALNKLLVDFKAQAILLGLGYVKNMVANYLSNIKPADVGTVTADKLLDEMQEYIGIVNVDANFLDRVFGGKINTKEKIEYFALAGDNINTNIAAHKMTLLNLLHGKNRKTLNSGRDEEFDTFIRFFFNQEEAMLELLEIMFAISSGTQGLVNVKFENKKFYISYSALKSQVEELFQSVDFALGNLRDVIDKDLYDKYRNKRSVGSFYWLQESLMEKVFSVQSRDTKLIYEPFDDVMRAVSDTFEFLSAKYPYDLDIVPGAETKIKPAVTGRTSFAQVLSRAIFYDHNEPHSGISDSSLVKQEDPASIPDMLKPLENLHFTITPSGKVLDTRYIARFQQLYTWDEEFTFNRSALFAFNQLVAKYLQAFYDATNEKIYMNLLDKFANGAFNRAINDLDYTYPDTVPALYVKHDSGGVRIPTADVFLAGTKYSHDDVNKLTDVLKKYLGEFTKTQQKVPDPKPNKLLLGHEDKDFHAESVQSKLVRVLAEILNNNNAYGDANVVPATNSGYSMGRGATGLAPTQGYNNIIEALQTSANNHNIVDFTTRNFIFVNDFTGDIIDANFLDENTSKLNLLSAMILSNYSVINPARNLAANDKNMIKNMDDKKRSVDVALQGGGKKSIRTSVKFDEYLSAGKSNIFGKPIATGIDGSIISPTDENMIVLEGTAKAAYAKYFRGEPSGKDFGKRYDSDGEHVLFTSLAHIIKNVISSKQQTTTYLFDNVADIPIYMKEKMRANLPAFKNLFSALRSKCEFMKKIVTYGDLDLQRVIPAGLINPWPQKLVDPKPETESAKTIYIGVLESIINGCTALISSGDQVLKEIGDDPKYMEIYQNSIKDYKSQHGKLPLTPISNMLYHLRHNTDKNSAEFLPIHSLGEPEFKLAYGTRQSIHQKDAKISAESFPGFSDLVESYNIGVTSKSQFEKSHVENLLKSYVGIVRYVFDSRHVKGLITPLYYGSQLTLSVPGGKKLKYNRDASNYSSGLFTRQAFSVNSPAAFDSIKNKQSFSLFDKNTYDGNTVRQLRGDQTTPNEMIKFTESSFREEQLAWLVKPFKKTDAASKKTSLCVQNIIDLNIIPINVHALMRDIPLANLYNYAYTFDRLVVELNFGVNGENSKEYINRLCDDETRNVDSAQTMLVTLLLDPYADIYKNPAVGDHLKGMMIGNANTGDMGRPKFLSDELYGKALFGSLYNSDENNVEAGPVGYSNKYDFAEILFKYVKVIYTHMAQVYNAGANNSMKPPQFDDDVIRQMIRDANYDEIIGNSYNSRMGKIMLLCVAAQVRYYLNNGIDPSDNYLAFNNHADQFVNNSNNNAAKDFGDDLDALTYNSNSAWAKKLKKLYDKYSGKPGYKPTNIVQNNQNSNLTKNLIKAATDQTTRRKITYIKNGKIINASANLQNTETYKIQISRFNSILIRNLIFITNLYRTLRIKLKRDLTYSKDIIHRSIPIVKNDLTELYQ